MIGNRELESGQVPDWAEFERTGETETHIRPKEGFFFGAGSWRFRADGNVLYIEYWDGTSWVYQGRFEAEA